MTTDSTSYLSELHQLLNQYFSLAEIRTLCLELNVDFEGVAGEEKPSRIRELLLSLGRNGRLPELVHLAKQQRPRVEWPAVPKDFELPQTLTSGDTVVPANQHHIYGDVVQGDKIEGDKVAGHKIQTQTYIEKQVIVTGAQVTGVEDLPPEPCDPPCGPPYQGLPSFDVGDYERFFGRDKLTAQLVNRLHDTRFLAVVGASGSGKSSVVRAGVVPTMLGKHQLEDGTEPPLGQWQALIMTPTARPLIKLAMNLYPDDKAAQSRLHDQIAESRLTNALATAIANLAPDDSGRKLLLVVDQFEELFTLCKDADKKQLLVDNLLTAAEQLPQARIIITLRADFYNQAIQLEGLEGKLERQQAIVSQMQAEELAAAILKPAERGNWQLQAGLTKQMLADVGNEPGALPLLSHTLLETWKRRRGRIMTLSGYVEAGGIKGAISQTATQTYDGLTSEQQAIAKQVFLRLTELGQGTQDTRRRVERAEIGQDGKTRQVLKRLADARLVTIDKEVVEVAHEVLIREWPLLRFWLSEEREGLIIHRRLTNAAQTWGEKGKDPSYLYTGLRLTEAAQWAKTNNNELNDLEHRFLETSLKAEKQRQRTRRFVQVSGAVVLAILIMLGIGAALINNERNDAIEARETAVAAQATSDVNAAEANLQALAADTAKGEAEAAATIESEARSTAIVAQSTAQADATRANIAEATAIAAQIQTEEQREIVSLLAQSQALMNVRVPTNQDVAQARLMAVTAAQIDLNITGGQNGALLTPWNYHLTRALTASYYPLTILDDGSKVAWNANGTRLASTSLDGSTIIWETNNWNQVATLNTNGVTSLAWNISGSYLATVGGDRVITVWDTTSWQPSTNLHEHSSTVRSIAWSFDGRLLASSSSGFSSGDQIIIWDTLSWQPLITLTNPLGGVRSLAWSTDGTQLISGGAGIVIWDTANWQPIITFDRRASQVASVALNIDGSQLATGTSNGIIIWDMASLQPLVTLNFNNSSPAVDNIAWNPDGTRLVSSGGDAVILWDTISWQPIITLDGHTSPITSIAWNNDGSRLASAGNNIILWDTASWQPTVSLTNHTSSVSNIDWRSDGTQLASASGDAVTIWDATNWQQIASLSNHTNRFGNIDWNPDGTRLATVSDDESVIIWDTSNWQQIYSLTDQKGSVNGIDWNAEGSLLATAFWFTGIIIWDTTTWQPLVTLTEHTAPVTKAVWNADGNRLATVSADEIIIVWDTSNWQPLATLSGHSIQINSVAWNADSSRFASASHDGTIIVWDTATWQPIITLTGHSSIVTSIAWNTDGTHLASASSDRTVIIWDAISWQPLTTLTDHTDIVSNVAWNNNSSLLASASYDRSIIITDYDLFSRNCELAQRNFTWEEWQRIFPNEPYRTICPQWPVHPSVPPEEQPES